MNDRAEVERVRRALSDPRSVAERLGIDKGAVKQRTGVMVRCIAHDDRGRPNLSLTEVDGSLRARCFSCGYSADVFGLVATREQLDVAKDFPKVLERCAELASIQLPKRDEGREAPKTADPDRLEASLFAAMMKPLANLGRLDGSGPSAASTEYLSKRGLIEAAHADGWFAVTPHCGRIIFDAFGSALGKRTGLFEDDASLRFPANVLCIPWRTPDGRVDTIQRRRLDGENRQRYVFPTNRGAIHPYGVEQIAAAPADAEIVITEGAPDVLARRRIDDSVVIGAAGTSFAPVSGWAPIVRDRVVRIGFDADKAGDGATPKLARELYANGAKKVLRERVKNGKDWAEVIS